MQDVGELKNAAVQAWINTFPVEDRLAAFLSTLPESVKREVEQSARAIYASADGYLHAEAERGVLDMDRFDQALRGHLLSQFYWVNESTLNTLHSYTNWMSWHEGYAG